MGVSCPLSRPMQEAVTARQSCQSHFQKKRGIFHVAKTRSVKLFAKHVIIAAGFAGIQEKSWKRGPPLGKPYQAQ